MALDVEKLIADTKAARAAADAQKAKVDKAAAALEASKKANKSTTAKVANEINYVNSLSTSLADIEGKLTTYAISIGRGDKLGPGEQKEFDALVKQYKDADKAYKSTIAKIDKTLAAAPSPTKVEVKKGKVSIAPTAEEMVVTDLTGKPQAGVTAASVDQINKQLDALNKDPRGFIFAMKPSDRINLAQTLTAAGYQTPDLNGEFNDGLVANYKAAISQAKSWNTNNKNLEGYVPVDLSGFLTYRTRLSKAAGAAGAGAGGGANLPYGQIYDKTAAKAKVNEIVKSVLNREATAKEVVDLSAKLIKAQKDNPYRTVNGRTVGGLDVEQFLIDLVQAKPEYASKMQAKQDITAQGIDATAKANGLKLRPEELKAYADRVKNGEDIKVIEGIIRSTASLGQPDAIKKLIQEGTDLETIYSPYKRIMANSLGINSETITLDDPTLRMAIGPDKEMSLYDFKKAIRTDNRWKYSQEANDEVTNMINQVKRDFGFMG
jgi:hypothetical protein